jgi:8-oxo-dGTP diphosphatase
MNSQLYDKQYKIPPDVLKSIQATLISYPTGEGVKRAKFMLNNGMITYQAMKRLKNFFDHFNPEADDKISYAHAGGNLMKSFVDRTLNADRDAVERSKNAKQTYNVDPNLGVKAFQSPRLTEAEKKDKKKEELQKNAVAVIVNSDNKILLLKRGKGAPWMPEKWSLVGGSVEKGESPQNAVEREILEEVGLEVDKFVKTFTIQRKPDSIETVFACRYSGEPTDIDLDTTENTNYGWYDIDEMNYLDVVPNLIEYVTLAFTGKKYND